jgi:DNA-directed RNA polymerase specialized sigma24 family protein
VELTGALAEADWQSHRPAVFGAAYRILGSVAEAEDVTQEVWLRAAPPTCPRCGICGPGW